MKQLGTLQIRIMQQLWGSKDPMTVDIMQALLNYDKKDPELAYTTVGTVLRNLVKAGFVRSYKGRRGPKHWFEPLVEQDDYIESQLKQLLVEFFDGNEHDLCNFIHTTLGKGDHA